MAKYFQVNGNAFYFRNPQVKKNTFIGMPVQQEELPVYEEVKDQLARPVWDGHTDAINCYYRTWELAFTHLRKPNAEAGFVSNFIDTAFNDYLFMWDSSFILMFGKYGSRVFDFQRTLDNMYSHQHKDGFICREICEYAPGEQFSRDDPSSTGPNVMPWAEWEYFLSTANIDRLSRVFDPLCAYHRWLQLYRSWPDGSYWTTGLGCGMDNSPRTPMEYDCSCHHGFMSWIDACAQQYLSANVLVEMAKVLGREDEVDWLKDEMTLIYNTVNNTMWSEKDQFYYDKLRDGTLNGVKTAASYWTLLADMVPEERKAGFIAHLDNENEFKTPNRVASLSKDHPGYKGHDGGYWCGAVWAPTNYMILRALTKHGYHDLAYDIGRSYVDVVVSVYNRTNTLYENYSPELDSFGSDHGDFVGWTGIAPISVMFEYVFGIKPDAQAHKVTWHVSLTDRHGIEQYPLGDATVDLICEARECDTDEPVINIKSDKPVTVEVFWNVGSKVVTA